MLERTTEVLIKQRKPKAGMSYKLDAVRGSQGETAIALDHQPKIKIDRGSMSASCTIATGSIDRSGDILWTLGVDLENYRKNPVVLWNHGLSGLSIPIGKSESPDGEFAVKVYGETCIDATCFFSQHTPEAEQVFHLVSEGIVRASSVGFIPTGYHSVMRKNGDFGLDIFAWELLEWSWVAVPDNPEAVSRILADGRVCGRELCEPVRKGLMSRACGCRPGEDQALMTLKYYEQRMNELSQRLDDMIEQRRQAGLWQDN